MNAQLWRELKAQTNPFTGHWRNLVVLLVDLAVVIASWNLWQAGGIAALAAVPLLALALLHSYLLMHEATHGTGAPWRWLNNLLGHVCGWLIYMPFLPRQSSHVLHHVWTGHPTGDPANRRLIARFKVMDERQAKRMELIWKWWLPLFALNDRIGLWLAPFREAHVTARRARMRREKRSVLICLLGYLAVAVLLWQTGMLATVAGWYSAAWLVLLLLEELVNLPHHAETPLLADCERALPYWEQQRVTHSCRSVPIWSRYILLNFNLHVAHHWFPFVPWYQLSSLEGHAALHDGVEVLEVTPNLNELSWSLQHRRRPLLKMMGHYFQREPERSAKPAQH